MEEKYEVRNWLFLIVRCRYSVIASDFSISDLRRNEIRPIALEYGKVYERQGFTLPITNVTHD